MLTASRCAALVLTLALAGAMLAGCAVQVETFRDYDDPLREQVISGESDEKILVVPIHGVIDVDPDTGLASRKASVVQEVVATLTKAEGDEDIKAIVLQIDSPGGTVVASDILYREIMRWRERTGTPCVALMMTVAASGGYMASLAGDVIVAHPSAVTGSIGTVMIRPNVAELMGKIGVGAEVTKSGALKDIGSPFRRPTDEERGIFQSMIDDMNERFLALVAKRRGLDREALMDVADARVFTAVQAQRIGLVDVIGYVPDALAEARRLADLPEDARVVVYRRRAFGDDTLYNPVTSRVSGGAPSIDLGLSRLFAVPRSGFYHLWAPEYEHFMK